MAMRANEWENSHLTVNYHEIQLLLRALEGKEVYDFEKRERKALYEKVLCKLDKYIGL